MPRNHGAGELHSDQLYAQGKRGGAKRPGRPGAGYAASPAEILRWAIDDYSPGPVVPSAGTEASLARYRDALLTFHRESKRVRYAQRADAAPQHPRAL